MLSGNNFIGQTPSRTGDQYIQAFSPVLKNVLPERFCIATSSEINDAVDLANSAFKKFREEPAEKRAAFLEKIGEEIMAAGDILIERAMLETGLSEARLKGERKRTINQLQLFADLIREGSWVEAVIDIALPGRQPVPRPDLRKMLIPIGPVVVFGASNFPFAFSTAGGDTASALAAGNPVILKAHPSHPGINEIVTGAIEKAATECEMPDGIFSLLNINKPEDALALVKHPGVKAVGFTGSYSAGMAIYKAAGFEREIPVPVYAEMSSINPVMILPDKLQMDGDQVAHRMAASVALDAGQFCTNPGLIFVIRSTASAVFLKKITEIFTAIPPAKMLNGNICINFYKNRQFIADKIYATTLFEGDDVSVDYMASAMILRVSGADFIRHQELQHEIFGPATIVVECDDEKVLSAAIGTLNGQLTGTVMATPDDMHNYATCIALLKDKVGRIIYNGVPTGVEVCHAMVHGGPFPATTNQFTTSVGADAIRRFARPLCFQDCPLAYLPEELQNENPMNIMRKVNGVYTRDRWMP